MADIIPISPTTPSDEKWAAVKTYYESIYKDDQGNPIRFKDRLCDKDINLYWSLMHKLKDDLYRHVEKHKWAKSILLASSEDDQKSSDGD